MSSSQGPKRRLQPICGRIIGLLFIHGLLSGCMMVGPDFKQPTLDMPDNYLSTNPTYSTDKEHDLAHWWECFNDSILTSLVNRAVQDNLDLQLAESRIVQARATKSGMVSGLGPTVDTTASASRRQSNTSERNTQSITTNQYQAGFDAGWELDFFGGTRRSIEAANAELTAQVESKRDVLVTLTAEIARNYIDLRTFQLRLAVSRKNFKSQKHSAELIRQRFQNGFVSGLEVAAAETQTATTAAEIPLYEASVKRTIHKLGILLGSSPGALMEELSPALDIPLTPPYTPESVPSDLLRRRPDIRKAEANIHAETARIGVATSELFPKFSIIGSAGYQSGSVESLFNPVSLIWAVTPSINWNLFSSGRVRAKIEGQEAVKEQSVILYQQTVLSALLEVEDALISLEKEEKRCSALRNAVASSQKAAELATRLYSEGHTNYIEVLLAQRSLFMAEDAFVKSTGMQAIHMVTLFKALGGGWGGQG